MMSYLTIASPDGHPPRRVDFNGIARLFAWDEEAGPAAVQEPSYRASIKAATRALFVPLAEIAALFRGKDGTPPPITPSSVPR